MRVTADARADPHDHNRGVDKRESNASMPKSHEPANAAGNTATIEPSAPDPQLIAAMADLLADSALPGERDAFDRAASLDAAALVTRAALHRAPGDGATLIDSDGGRAPQAGNASRHMMRVAIINDDMPFLVDSIANCIDAAGLEIFRILHPVSAVRRDGDGVLQALLPRDASGERRESFVYMEVSRADARARRTLTAAIEETLASVRAAVRDWPQMQAALQQDADQCADAEAAALLRWLLDRNFTQLAHEAWDADARSATGLGLARLAGEAMLADATRDEAVAWFKGGGRAPLIIKSNRVSPVHRRVLIDLIILPRRDARGVTGLSIHAGLWTSAALSAAPEKVPMLRSVVADMMAKFGFDAAGHAGKALSHVLTQLPHDLAVSAAPAQLEALALTAMSIADRPRPKLELLQSSLKRHLFAFVWLPRDMVSTRLRGAIEAMLRRHTGASILNWTISMEDGGAALLRYVLDMRSGTMPDAAILDAEIKAMVRGWAPAIEDALVAAGEDTRAAALADRYAGLLPIAYRLDTTPAEAARDVLKLRDIDGAQLRSVRLIGGDALGTSAAGNSLPANADMRLKIYNAAGALPLSDAVPALENFGFQVLEELPTSVGPAADAPHIHDFRLHSGGAAADAFTGDRGPLVEGAIAAVLNGAGENDAFNQLVISTGLDPRSVGWLRAWFRYLRQAGSTYSIPTFVGALRNARDVTTALIDLFVALHDPARASDGAAEADATAARERILAGLEQVAAIDEDRILRLILAVIEATLRTNAFASAAEEALAFKLDSAKIPGLPKPLPWREIFVYSKRVEGIHLRAGPVARGGLRWSDRRDDFRTEILGLMKAQRVKNAVIVPTGAKGGFYPKALPDPASDRDAWLAEGTECYRIFIRTLLSITDNLDGEAVVHPADVVIRDGADPYFVVAADKGTATFSDVANAIALERDFWLGDAFASGGSNGYDHKAMGITARGAWLSVQRHFSEMGVDVQRDPVTVAGVGDMSGDVFGNGMLLSKSLRLIAAFDHRHIFIDPNPDAAKSWAERDRLFKLPRSSWADYDTKLISKGGGVFARSMKTIPLSAEAQAALGIDAAEMEPGALLAAVLQAPVDLLWFGGIGTYIKASTQNNAEVGDPANDRIRVDAASLRARAIGEGANLGITQAGRIEFARAGGGINTDFIDNSAGVDCSDNEVNIKIALNQLMRSGQLPKDDRDTLLVAMTDDVAALVLEDNRLQALALSIAHGGQAAAVPSIIRLIEGFEADGKLDRQVEGLASNDELRRRAADGDGLTRPELAVLLSTAKLAIQDACAAAKLGADPLLDAEVLAAFPPAMAAAHSAPILTHRLRGEIVSTKLANRMINRMGLIHPFELAEEEGVSIVDVVEVFAVVERVLGLAQLWDDIDAATMAEPARLELYGQVATEARAHMADLLRNAIATRGLADCVAALAPGVAALGGATATLLSDEARQQSAAFGQRLINSGAPAALAERVAQLARLDGAIGIVSLGARGGHEVAAVTRAFTALGVATGLDWAQGAAMTLSPSDPWERLLVAGLARDFQQMRLDTIARLGGAEPEGATRDWIERQTDRLRHFRGFVDNARRMPAPSPAMLAQLAGQARTLLARP